MKKCIPVKIAAVLCGIFSLLCMYIILRAHVYIYENAPTKIILDIIGAAGLAAAFVSVRFLSGLLPPKLCRIVLPAAALMIFAVNAAAAPYGPCHDAMDIHHILSDEKQVYYDAYMGFWINNKLTVYCYTPFVLLFRNTEIGVKVLNFILLAGFGLLIYFSVKKLSEKNGETTLFMLSLLSPYLLLTGPYIYLLSLFLSAAAIFFLTRGCRTGKILFSIFAALSFLLRPTASGAVLAFFVLYIILGIRSKLGFVKCMLSIAVTLVLCFASKSALGTVLYKTGLHAYPAMTNSAMVWTLELGTRPNGESTGTCSYTPFSDVENPDDIQRDFKKLWRYYYNDTVYHTDSYPEIRALQHSLSQRIIERTVNNGLYQYIDNIRVKCRNLFGNNYIPYYYKANVNDENMRIDKDLDVKFFAYQNIILLSFCACMLINAFRVFKNKDFSNGTITAAGMSAFAVIAVLLLFTEVSKKYMFDFLTPMLLCICLSLDRPIRNRAVFISLPLAAAAAAMQLTSYEIPIFRGCETELSKNGSICKMVIDMKNECRENYQIETYNGKIIDLRGRQAVTIYFPDECFDAFILHMPNGEAIRYSSQRFE